MSTSQLSFGLSLSPGRCLVPGAKAALVPLSCPSPGWGGGTGPGCQALPCDSPWGWGTKVAESLHGGTSCSCLNSTSPPEVESGKERPSPAPAEGITPCLSTGWWRAVLQNIAWDSEWTKS